jgi:hypothetical protein
MPMSKLLEKAFQEASKLSQQEQDTVAELVISFLHSDEAEEAEWDVLVQSPESQRFLDKMINEVKDEEARDGLLPFPREK